MTRKIIAMLLCICLLAALAGCGGGTIQQYEEEEESAAVTEAPAAEEDEPEATDEPAEATDEPEETEEPEPTDEPEADDEADTASATDLSGADEPLAASLEADAEPADGDEPAEAGTGEDSASDLLELDDASATDASDGEEEEPEPTADPGLGYAAYEPDQVVAVYDGTEITWREYYYWLNYYAGYIQYMAAMGATFSGWDGNDFDPDTDNAALVRTSAIDNMFQYHAIETLAEEEDLTVDEDAVKEAFDTAADSYGDGDGTCDEDEAAAYEEYLDGQFVDRALFDYMTGVGQLSEELFTALYGEDGSKVSDEDALAYAEEQGLMACKHILFMTVDPETGEALSDEEIEEKKAQADELYEQLAEVQDDPEELEKLFDELMTEHSEDTGLAYYPDGYLFASGVMVPIFEETTAALEEYGLSEPVQSDYGYHIILRLPVDPDGTFTASNGSSTLLRTAVASDDIYERLQKAVEKADITWEDDFETVDMAEIFGA